MKRYLILFACVALLASCSKTEKDFVGKYETVYTTKIALANAFSPFMSFRTSKKRETTAKLYYELSDIKINLFMDESEKKLKGEAEIVYHDVDNTFVPTVKTRKIDLDIVNMRMNNDTLEFSLENQMLKLESKKIKGQLVTNDEGTFLGLEQGVTGKNKYTDKNPFYKESKGEMDYYKVISADVKKDEIVKTFYQSQITDFQKQIDSTRNETEKKIFENSVKELEKKIK